LNILIIHNYYKYRGGEEFVVNAELNLLRQHDHSVHLLTADNRDIIWSIPQKIKFLQRLKKILKNRIDIIHIHNVYQIIGPSVYKILKKYNVPLIQTLHNFRFFCLNGLFLDNDRKICELCSNGRFINGVIKRCYQHSYFKSLLMTFRIKRARKYGFNNISKFVVLNKFTQEKILMTKSITHDKLIVKSNFLNQNNGQEISDQRYALYIGRISEEKGIDTLIDAFKDIDFKLKIAGNGELLTVIIEQCKKYPNIEILGYITGNCKDELIKNCSFLIIPSLWYEMFPISILEAYKYAKPVIASNIGGLPEIVIDGYSGYLFTARNHTSLELTILKMIKGNNYIELGINARRLFEEKYSAEINYNQLIAIYNHLIGEIN